MALYIVRQILQTVLASSACFLGM